MEEPQLYQPPMEQMETRLERPSRPFPSVVHRVQMEPLERSKPPSIGSIHRSISAIKIAKMALGEPRRNQ